MTSFLKGLAYLLIYTTPIQIGFLIWILVIIFTSDFSLMSLSTNDFLSLKIPWLKDWIYSWFWNVWLNFWWGFPAFIMVSLKTVLNYLIGIWLMNKVKELEQE
ncbi:MAG: hypothetical protein CMD59_01035 [Gammaproteobacteria bacterium]|jgi:hypothetical protein|nr:hypothetical protein [Gammaproteobacteria bacterium]|tara:strand:- start:148 stop:456 length:309 start_codon:yes stop_codon:yes gene_type:complete